MSAPQDLQERVSAAVNACVTGSNVRFISAWLALRFDPERGYAEMSSADYTFMGINRRSYWDGITRLLDTGVWRVEKRAGLNNANRYYPLFPMPGAVVTEQGGTGDEC